MRLFELARLNAGNGYCEKSLDFYKRSIPIVEKLDIEHSDPIGHATVLEHCAETLKLNNQLNQANNVIKKAQKFESCESNQRSWI